MLLDTHLLLWSLFDTARISEPAASLMKDASTSAIVSVVNFWEIAIKRSTGKLSAPDDLPDLILELGHEIMLINPNHAWIAGALPLHHRDPFDRLLIAQAQVENLPILTHDRMFEQYDVLVIRA